ncbi:UNVERIFIED_CONTAM: hypothetical protein Scaly_2782500 [Sesamum calycinum]|uniref:Uncharacterized protein n=1 Tax=Sesamum calycinum TaxID=2727403 RepID=A0AAW2IXB0_9LAMI
MASETPQYAPKRQHVVQEQPQKVKNIGTQFKPSLRYGPSFAKRYSHYHDDGEEEEESDDEYDQHESLPAVCGLLPRFCLKSSLCLLNPVPAMSVRTRVPTSSANKVQPRSSSAGSYSETENECRSGRTEPKSIDKIHKVKLDDEKTELTNESCRLESDSTSTYRDSPLSFLEDKEVHCIPEEKIHAGLNGFELQEGIRTFKEILADQGSPKESDGGALIIEKTLYVDTIGRVESPSLRSFSPDTQDTLGFPTSREEYHEIINNSMDQIHTIDSPLEDSKKLDTTDGQDKLLLNAQKLGEFNISSQFADSNKTCETGTPKAFGENGDFCIDSTTTENIEVTENKAAESLEKQLPAAITLGNSHQNYSEYPVPPPLPKSPSDSWLFRTLPSVPPKNSFLRSYLGAAINPENKGSKVPTSDTKWETIVKTTKMQGRHLHYSEGLLATIPET